METRRVLRKNRFKGRCQCIDELVLFDSIPHAEKKNSARTEHPMRLRERLRLVGKEHDPELTNHGVEFSIGEWKLHGVGLAPLHRAARSYAGSHVEHCLIQIRRDNGNAGWQCGCEFARHNPRPGGNLEHSGK
jgi:hypothetical protein